MTGRRDEGIRGQAAPADPFATDAIAFSAVITLPLAVRSGRHAAVTASGVTRQRMLAEPALLQRLRRSHQHDPGCDYEPDTGSRADFCLVANPIAKIHGPG